MLSIAHCCPSFVRVRRALLSSFASLALHLAVVEVEGAGRQRSCMVDAGGGTLVGCVHPVVAHGGRVWVSWVLGSVRILRLQMFCSVRFLGLQMLVVCFSHIL